METQRETDIQQQAGRNGEAVVPAAKSGSFAAKRADWGLKRALYHTLMRSVARHFGFHIHYVVVGADRPDLRPAEPPVVPAGYETRLGTRADFLPYAGKMADLTEEFIDTAFSNDDESHVTFYQGELVAFSFNTRVAAPVTDQLEVIVPEGFRYGYKSWTHIDHRRNKLSRMGGWFKQNFANRPFNERSVFYIETHNYASLLHSYRHPSLRGIRMGLVGWVTIFGKQIPFASRRAKWLGFEFQRKDKEYRRQYI